MANKLPTVRSLKPKLNHAGLRTDRNVLDPERIFIEEWIELNTPRIGLNDEHGALDHILNLRENVEQNRMPYENVYPPVSQRDADVAATVIQWLGTGMGKVFLERCEKRIAEARCEELEANHRIHNLGLPA
jgi:hypothetical protein